MTRRLAYRTTGLHYTACYMKNLMIFGAKATTNEGASWRGTAVCKVTQYSRVT